MSSKREVTTTGSDIPKNYFPSRRKKKSKKVDVMNEALFAVQLVEDYGFDPKDAMEVVLEQDNDMAAKKMAKKAAPDDPEKQKELESKYKEKMAKMKKERKRYSETKVREIEAGHPDSIKFSQGLRKAGIGLEFLDQKVVGDMMVQIFTERPETLKKALSIAKQLGLKASLSGNELHVSFKKRYTRDL